MAKTNRTHVALVLDESGSMYSVREQTIAGFNEQLRVLKESVSDTNEVFGTLVIFSNNSRIPYDHVPVQEIPEINWDIYKADGPSTAMYDAVIVAIERLQRVKAKKNDAFLVIIVSDGCENASSPQSHQRIGEMVTACQDAKNWTFSYVGANQDLRQVHEKMHIPLSNMVAYASTQSGTDAAFGATASATSSYMGERSRGVSPTTNFYNNTEDAMSLSEDADEAVKQVEEARNSAH